MRILRTTIAAKLILSLIGSGILLIICTTSLRFAYDYSRELNLLHRRVAEVEHSTVPALVNSIWLADWDMVRVQAEGIALLPEILRVEVTVDERAIVVVGDNAPASVSRHTFPLIKQYRNRDHPLGTLTLFPDENALRQRLLGALPVEIGIPVFTILVISTLLYYLFHRLAGRHLISIAGQLRSLGREPMAAPLVLDRQRPAAGETDEIDLVVSSFNEMQRQLQRSFAELRQANDGLSQEVKDRIRAEKALRENRTMLRNILDTAPQAIFWKDENGVYLGCNQVFAEAAGVPDPEEIVGKTDFDLPWPRAEAEAYQADDREVIRTKQSKWHIIEPLQKADGQRLWIDTTKVPLLDDTGNAHGVLGIFGDITERIRAEDEKAKLQTQLNQAQKMEAIGVLAGGIAHDFNNILAAIMGYAELARAAVLPDSQPAHDLDSVLLAAHRAKDLVTQILTFSRQSGPARSPLRLQSLVKESLKMLRASLPTTITIKEDIDPQGGTVLADPTQMHQLVMNLCTNAFHAMETTGGILSVEVHSVSVDAAPRAQQHQVEQGKYIQLTVSDTGTGIAPEIVDRIFDPYFTTKGVGKGTGMGLSIAHGIVKDHGGTIEVESTPGTQTTFRVLLPEVDDEERKPDEAAREFPRGNERILLVDDEELLVEMGREMLERSGYRVTVRRNGKEALQTFMNAPDRFDLVITDQTMPGMTGVDLARNLLRIRPDIPVILCTGFSNVVDEDLAKAIGIREFAMKPLSWSAITKMLRKIFDGRRGDEVRNTAH
ncbi:MAG: ATP-binding protein [Thermodesulfobacteriota bacterium]